MLGRSEWLGSRPFTTFYLIITSAILLFIGRGDYRSCDTDVSAMICEMAIWPTKLFSAPHEFVLSWLTGPWFMHSLDQIIFSTAGFLIFMQSYECRAGTRNALIIFFGGTIVASTMVALGLNLGDILYPDSELINEALSRNWMGGSVAFYASIGALAHFARTPWAMLGTTIAFESWNFFLNDISLPTSSAHMIGMTFGYCAGWWLHPHGVLNHSISTEPSSAIVPR